MPKLTRAAVNLRIAKKLGIERSPLWDQVRKAYIKNHGTCIVCGSSDEVEVHHMFPFHYVVALEREDLEIDDRNFVSLCENKTHNHHILVGHLDDFQSYNPPSRPDQLHAFITRFKNKLKGEIMADSVFKTAMAAKPPHLDDMNEEEKNNLKSLMMKAIPPKPALLKKARAARKRM